MQPRAIPRCNSCSVYDSMADMNTKKKEPQQLVENMRSTDPGPLEYARSCPRSRAHPAHEWIQEVETPVFGRVLLGHNCGGATAGGVRDE